MKSINYEKCAPADVRYDSTQSPSSEENGAAFEVDYGYLCASGNLMIDSLVFGDIQVKGQPFLEATSAEASGLS